MHGYYDQDPNDPLNDASFLTTPEGRTMALAALAEQQAKRVPVNWIAQDALRAVRGVYSTKGAARRGGWQRRSVK